MSELFINIAKAAAVTGHRTLYNDFNRERLEQVFNKLIEGGFDTFLVGMAVGFDTECFLVLEKIRKSKPIKIIACIPCLNQDAKFSDKQKILYRKMIDCADEKVILSEKYTPSCMMDRNRYLVDNSSLLICYKRRETGGTAATVKYAVKQKKMILPL